MTPRDAFGLALRIVGLLALLLWLVVLVHAVATRSGLLLIQSFVLCAAGGHLITGCPWLLELAYPERRPEVGARTVER